MPFLPDLVDLIHHSELVISRAGYNIVNEILLTGTKAILVPESHGGGEQEMRARSIQAENIRVLTEPEVLRNSPGETILELLNEPTRPISDKFDKYAIGKSIIEDLENWKSRSRRR